MLAASGELALYLPGTGEGLVMYGYPAKGSAQVADRLLPVLRGPGAV